MKKDNFFVLGMSAIALTLSLAFTACGKVEHQRLVGNWLLEDGQPFNGITEYYKLEKNGSGIADISTAISWKIENGRFSYVRESDSKAYARDYKISGKTLTITYNGKNYIYKKIVDDDNGYKKWRSSIETDPLADSKDIYFRVMSSTNTGRYLYIRRRNGKLEMYINLNIEIASATNVTFRIDGGEPITNRWTLSTDKKALFYPNNSSLMPIINSLLEAEKIAVRCSPSNQSTLTEVFDVTGFKEMVTKYNDDLQWF